MVIYLFGQYHIPDLKTIYYWNIYYNRCCFVIRWYPSSNTKKFNQTRKLLQRITINFKSLHKTIVRFFCTLQYAVTVYSKIIHIVALIITRICSMCNSISHHFEKMIHCTAVFFFCYRPRFVWRQKCIQLPRMHDELAMRTIANILHV